VDRREPGLNPAAPLQLGLELGQREVGRRLDQLAQVGLVGLEHGPPVPAEARRCRAAGRAHPPHQLDRGRRADGKAPRGAADGAATLDRPHDAQPQVHGHRLRIPKQAGHLFRIDVGHRSDLIPARVPR